MGVILPRIMDTGLDGITSFVHHWAEVPERRLPPLTFLPRPHHTRKPAAELST